MYISEFVIWKKNHFFHVNQFTGNKAFKLPVFLKENMGIFENVFFFGNMPYENLVISTFLLIRCHIETDYYEEKIHFD
jgi:hypothetical protein